MCGIIGYTGEASAVPVLLDALSTLEYRGYDSAGIAVHKEGLQTQKAKGRLSVLADLLADKTEWQSATCGIGHTRWATHGVPSDRNAHPHRTSHLALVHNGIIENYAELATELAQKGYRFSSETDTEIAACLIDYYYTQLKDERTAIFRAAARMRGSYAFGILFEGDADRIYAIRHDSPLVVAATPTAALIASDIPAILAHTREYYRPDDGVLAVLEAGRVTFFDQDGKVITQPVERVDWDVEQAQKGGCPHFMLKEIHEEPEALCRTLAPYQKDGLPQIVLPWNELPERIHVVACGTAMHAGLVGARMIERMARIPVQVEIASEFRYREPILGRRDLVLLLSQSGETADTLAALRYAKAAGVPTLAIVNVMGSSVAREADHTLYTYAGPEIAVASTKAYSVQCALLTLLALQLALQRGKMPEDGVRSMASAFLTDVPKAVRAVLEGSDALREIARELAPHAHVFYIGRGIDSDLCTEGSLKLKEISYIHSEAYAAGELKHGTISLIEDGTPVIAVLTDPQLAPKTVSGMREVRARGGKVIAIVTPEIAAAHEIPADQTVLLPRTDAFFAPFSATTALQLLAYHVSAQKGLDVDKPRNLAKSVTVE